MEEKIINISNPSGLPTIEYLKLEPFQGSLKNISDKNIKKMVESIIRYGITFPKAVWENNGKMFIIDGHATKLALSEVEAQGYKVGEIPYYLVEAENKTEAGEKLLILNNTIGKVTPEGLYEFINDKKIDFFGMKNKMELPNIDLDVFEKSFFTDEPLDDDDNVKYQITVSPGDADIIDEIVKFQDRYSSMKIKKLGKKIL